MFSEYSNLKYILLIFFLNSSNLFAECISGKLNLRPEIKFTEGVSAPSDMHLPLGVIEIKLPAKYLSMDLQSLQISKGEVAVFYIPLAYKIINGSAYASLNGTRKSMKNFELEVRFSNSTCSQSLQTMLLYGN